MSETDPQPTAGNGLLGRRGFLTAAAGMSGGLLVAGAAANPRPPWMTQPGLGMSATSAPSEFEDDVRRIEIGSRQGTTGSGASRTPLQLLDGIITPSRLHFERHHSGIPEIDPAQHRLLIHGMVERPLTFDLDTLARYPSVSAIQFLECSGNSGGLTAAQPVQGTCSALHGLVSGSEWGGVPIAALLDEAGVKPEAKWVIATGADAAMMSRSIPLEKMLDDAVLALHQNGERLRPANGYPMRLFLPGWEGNASVKWLYSLRVTDQPGMTKDETSKYSDLQTDGTSRLFTFPMGVKSLITNPSPGLSLTEKGVYQISGLAWSGAGKIRQVEVSADGGKSWAPAELDHTLPKSLTRFRVGWRWQGQEAVLLSRATDEKGAVQPTRKSVLAGRNNFYHYNALQAWAVSVKGELSNVYV